MMAPFIVKTQETMPRSQRRKEYRIGWALRRKSGYMSTYYLRGALHSNRQAAKYGRRVDPLYARICLRRLRSPWVRVR